MMIISCSAVQNDKYIFLTVLKQILMLYLYVWIRSGKMFQELRK